MSKYLFNLALWATVVVALLASCAQAGQVFFGQSASFSGGAWEPGEPYNRGLLAAFKEANDAGGVNNNTLELISLDDQYDITQIEPNVRTLLNISKIFVFVGLMGSPTTARALPLAAAAKMPIVGALTGSAVFRKTFNPWTINVRAGYDDEAMAMLRLFITEKQFRRVSVIYQDDAFGSPAKNAILEAMKNINLQLASVHKYDKPNIPTIDYAAYAQDVWQHRPQGIILYCVEGFSNPFLKNLYAIQTYPVAVITGSWIGDGIRNYLQRENLDPTNFFMTQVMPHPMADLNITKQYRAAVIAREGLANATAKGFNYLSIEGYVVGRVVVEALRRTPSLDRADFLKAVYQTKMFELEEMLAGPYSNDCNYDPGTAKGRSSFCFCNQGLRLVATTVLTAAYDYVEAVPSLLYPMTECWATKDVVQRPLLLANIHPTVTSTAFTTYSTILGAGMRTNSDVTVLSRDLSVTASTGGNETVVALNRLGDDTLLLGVLGSMEISAQTTYPVFPTPSEVPRLTSVTFDRNVINLLATLQQELHTHAKVINTNFSSLPVHLIILQEVASATTDGSTVQEAMQLSLESFEMNLAGSSTFITAADLTAQLGASPAAANLIVVGIKTTAHATALKNHLESRAASNAFVTFSDASLHWTDLAYGHSASTRARIFFATNLPMWTPSTSEFAIKYQEAMKVAGLTANVSNPTYLTGYFLSRVMQFILVRSNGDASPTAFMFELYRTSVVAMEDVILGPYVDQACEGGEDCRCNQGARTMYLTSVEGVLTAQPAGARVVGSKCGVAYVLKTVPAKNYTAVIVVAVIVPLILIVVLAVAARFAHRHAQVANAPKDVTKFSTMFVSLKKETLLWEEFPDGMNTVMKRYDEEVEKGCKQHNCYKVKYIGGAVLIAAVDADNILKCAAYISRTLEDIRWSECLGVAEDGTHIRPLGARRRSASASSRGSSRSARSRRSHRNSTHGQQSDTSSLTSNEGKGGKDSKLTVKFSVGVHSGVGRCIYDERNHAYDYSGPAVDGAAVASDRAQGDQLLMTSAVQQTAYEEDCFVEYTAITLGEKELVLLQVNQPGRTARVFTVEDNSDANVDSIAAQLEQQSSGVTLKRVTVASVYLHGVEKAAATQPREVFAKRYTKKLQEIQEICKLEKGYLHAAVGPRLILSFNAVNPTPQAVQRAYSAVESICEMEREEDASQVTAGIASENAVVGSITVGNWKHDAVMSRVVENATILQRLCTVHTGVSCFASSALHEELSLFSVEEYIDLMKLPETTRYRALIALRGFQDNGDGDEWMYELDQAEATNPYFRVNQAFDKLINGSADGAFAEARNTVAELAEEKKGTEGFKNLSTLFELEAAADEGDSKGMTRRDQVFEQYLKLRPILL